jgi:hypothetical protein
MKTNRTGDEWKYICQNHITIPVYTAINKSIQNTPQESMT